MGYYFYHPSDHKVFGASGATFLERKFLLEGNYNGEIELDEVQDTNESRQYKDHETQVEEPLLDVLKLTRKLSSSIVEVQELNVVQEQVNEPVPNQIEQQQNPAQDDVSNEVDHNDDDPETYEEETQGSDNEIWQMDVKTVSLMTIEKFNFVICGEEPSVYKKFSMKDLGEATYILGIKIYRDRSRNLLGLSQSLYIYTILKSFSSDRDDSKSISGYVFTLNGGAVSWESSKQATVADLVTEVEYIAAGEAAKEAVWMKKFLTKLSVVPSIEGVVPLLCDNTGATAQEKNQDHTKSPNTFCEGIT
ncbi:uncharacterized protein [Nicotiana sylvestris]|uniref:uncharacterized protein n=1 Tax=Nicotiana sylvestris TaxID=4096 RepID=UPI00388C73B6